ncbi:hypothetical protein [Sphingosinicella sp. CPCC 101087]|uniref:hypothetical protein n=1 Tax=Sphingosinicella sp. CPCC 101087 TaxID=2497754 RepID=UPI00101D791A|nr:hypothetical protein [Sphingosinicella sp. CPCC 101087]
MRRLCFALFLLVAGCGRTGERGPGEAVDAPEEGRVPVERVQTETPIGLYEAGSGAAASQLCIVEADSGELRFGLVVRTASGTCSGAGQVSRRSETLSLLMAGNSACPIQARAEGVHVSFPPTLPAGCSYYCAPGASLAGARLDKTGGTEADAMRARDLVGDALCEGLGGM